MTAIEQAVKEAIGAGYNLRNTPFDFAQVEDKRASDFLHVADLFLDRDFWIALGKARGWKEERTYCHGSPRCIKGVSELHRPCAWETSDAEWKENWREFIDHLIDGGTPESFFASLAVLDSTTPNTKI